MASSQLNDMSLGALLRGTRDDETQRIVNAIEARIAEHDNPTDEGEEQYVAGLRDALAIIRATASE